MTNDKKPKVFISHATADTELVKKFVELLRLGVDVPREQIFCTSLQGMRIPTGESFVSFIKEQIKDCHFVISLITPSYYESLFCMCELGAVWVMEEKDFFPIIVPPLGYDDLKAVLSGTQSGQLNDKHILSEVHDRLRDILQLGPAATGNWEEKRDGFINNFNRMEKENKIKGPSSVPFATHEKLVCKYESVQSTVQGKEKEIEELKKQVKELKACKDRKEVAKVMKAYRNEQEQLQELILKFNNENLPSSVIEALFYEYRGESWHPRTDLGTEDNWEQINSAEEHGYLCVDDGLVSPEPDHPPIARAKKELHALCKFIAQASEEFLDEFRDENDYKLSLSNRTFWQDHLNL